MGAEGSIVVMPLAQWQEHTDIDPGTFGLYVGTMLGVEAVWDYYGEPWYEMRIEMYRDNDEERELAAWFRDNAEDHEVWT